MTIFYVLNSTNQSKIQIFISNFFYSSSQRIYIMRAEISLTNLFETSTKLFTISDHCPILAAHHAPTGTHNDSESASTSDSLPLLLQLHLQLWLLAPFCSSGAHCLKWCMAKILTNVQKWVMSSSCKQNAIVVAPVSVAVVAYSAWSHYLLLTFSCTRRRRHLCSCCCCSFYYP